MSNGINRGSMCSPRDANGMIGLEILVGHTRGLFVMPCIGTGRGVLRAREYHLCTDDARQNGDIGSGRSSLVNTESMGAVDWDHLPALY